VIRGTEVNTAEQKLDEVHKDMLIEGLSYDLDNLRKLRRREVADRIKRKEEHEALTKILHAEVNRLEAENEDLLLKNSQLHDACEAYMLSPEGQAYQKRREQEDAEIPL
jgi:hypothetical protein